MIFIIAILLYSFLIVIKRILKPRTLPRRCDYVFENNLFFLLVCGLYVAYKLFIQNMTLQGLRRLSFYATL